MSSSSSRCSTPPPDLTHHLSMEARLRKPNPMKAIWKLTRRKPNMVSLANGDPHFSLYPIRRVEYEMASVDEADPVANWRKGGPRAPSTTLVSSSYDSCALPLHTGLQYSHGAGLPDAQRAVTELTNYYHAPSDHVCTLTLGNGDGISKCFRLLGEPGDHFLTDEFAFSSITNAPLAQGIKWVPVKMDAGGMLPEDLEKILANWDPERGRRPHVLYVVPCGQNPTGSTLSLERRKRIYEIAQRFDLMIIEDDPYYYLQYGAPSSAPSATEPTKFVPSILSLDTDGRVLRVDSFSKIMAPGMRLGWITSSALFHEHLVTLTDSSTHHPHGFGQMLITELLAGGPHGRGWGIDGFDRWVRGLRAEYSRRAARFLELFAREVAPTGFARASPPEAGMFVWIQVAIERHPRYRADLRRVSGDRKAPRTNVKELMEELFERCLDGGLVIMPASIFALSEDPRYDDCEDPVEDRLNYLRATFAGTEEAMEQGLAILGQTLREFFADEKQVA